MGASLGAGAGAGGRRRRSRSRARPMSEINMTPFIDVMLVLLIIFMVAAPLIAVGVPIDLPQAGAKPLNIDKAPITLAIDERGQVFLQDQPVPDGEIVTRLQTVAKANVDDRIYVRGHRQVGYGRVAEVMATVTGAGFKRVALVTEPKAP